MAKHSKSVYSAVSILFTSEAILTHGPSLPPLRQYFPLSRRTKEEVSERESAYIVCLGGVSHLASRGLCWENSSLGGSLLPVAILAG